MVNGLPLDIRQPLSLDVFKSKLKNYDFDSRLRNFSFAFIHGFLVKQVFIISHIVAVVNKTLVR